MQFVENSSFCFVVREALNSYNLSARKWTPEDFCMKKTYQPSKIKHAHEAGFRARMKTAGGRAVLARRRAKGRAKIAA